MTVNLPQPPRVYLLLNESEKKKLNLDNSQKLETTEKKTRKPICTNTMVDCFGFIIVGMFLFLAFDFCYWHIIIPKIN